MRGKVVVGDGEDVGQALARLRRKVCVDRALNKWPVWAGHPATEKQRRRQTRWLRAMKAKWRRVHEERHNKQPAR